MDQNDIDRVQAHLKRTFGNPHIAVKARPKQKDSAEVEMKAADRAITFDVEVGDHSRLVTRLPTP